MRPDEVVATSRAAAHAAPACGLPAGGGDLGRGPQARGCPPFYRKLDLTVTGIGVVSTQVVQDDIDADRTGFLIGTPGAGPGVHAVLHRHLLHRAAGAGGNRYDAAVDQGTCTSRRPPDLRRPDRIQLLQLLQVYNTSAIEAEAQSAIHPEAIALGVFGLIAALAALIIGAQSVSRQLRAATDDASVLRALGAGPAATTADGVLGMLAAVVAGALLAVAVAIAPVPVLAFRARPRRRSRAAGSTWTPRCSGSARSRWS